MLRYTLLATLRSMTPGHPIHGIFWMSRTHKSWSTCNPLTLKCTTRLLFMLCPLI
jgi:hypothetical protein